MECLKKLYRLLVYIVCNIGYVAGIVLWLIIIIVHAITAVVVVWPLLSIHNNFMRGRSNEKYFQA